jgi:hypothetical protein
MHTQNFIQTDYYYCDDDFYYSSARQDNLQFPDIKLPFTLEEVFNTTLIGMFCTLIFGPIFLSIFKINFPKTWRTLRRFVYSDKEVVIVRGVPGAGKKHYVYQLEKKKDDVYGICDLNNYFEEGSEYKFVGSKLGKAESFSRLRFMELMQKDVQRIYVLGIFNHAWMYKEYEELAKMNGYPVKVVELHCSDLEHLKHYNKRSTHKVPLAKSKSAFSNWELDLKGLFQEPYLEEFPGDCLPSNTPLSKEILDAQLDDYHLYGPKKDTIDNEPSPEDDLKEWTDLYLDQMDEEEVKTISSRDYYHNHDSNELDKTHEVTSEEELVSEQEESSWADAGSDEDREKYSITDIVGKRVKIRALDNTMWTGKIVVARRSMKTRNTDEVVLVNLDYDDPVASKFIKDENIDLYNSYFVWVEDPDKAVIV